MIQLTPMVKVRLTWALIALVPVLVLAVFFVLPVIGMIGRGLWIDGRFDPLGVAEVLVRPRVRRVLWLTCWSAAGGTAVSVALGLPAAYVVHRLEFPGRQLLRALLLVPFVLPTVVVGVAFRQLFAGPLAFMGADGTAIAIIAALAFFNISVVVRAVGASWESMDPRPAEAAAALGATPAQVFRTVTLPSLRPAIVAAAAVVFLFCATAFGVVLMLGGPRYATVETEIYLLTTNLLDLRAAAALSVLQLLVIIGLLVVLGRLDRTPRAAINRVSARRHRPALSDLPALGATGVALGLLLIPLATLVLGSFRRSGAWTLLNYQALARYDESLDASALDALVNSLQVAFDATWMSVGLGLSVAAVLTRLRTSATLRRTGRVVDGLFALPLGVSAVTLGFGLLITLDRQPLDFRDSLWLVPIAQAMVALPLVVRTLAPILAGLDERQRQAAASLGASGWRAIRVVEWPALRRPLVSAAGFSFAVSLGEFGATSFLARDGALTLPVLIYRLIGTPGSMNLPIALAASVVLAVVSAGALMLVEHAETRVGWS